MESLSSYQHFTEQDFIADPLFQDWVLKPDEENSSFWEVFFEQYPDKKAEGEVAIRFLKSISFKEDLPDENTIKASFVKHLDSIQERDNTETLVMPKRAKRVLSVWLAACVTGVLIMTAALLFSTKKEAPVLVKTDYSNTRTVVLPDSSRIILNANSNVKFNEDWSENNKREIWLNGEAYFDVRHINKDTANIKSNERFIVHTNDLSVEVLGTSFDVRNRRGKTEVVLERGKIEITFRDGKRGNLVMKPGDFVSYNAEKNELLTNHTIAKDYAAWREKKLILNDPKVSEIISYLEDNFGYKITVEGKGLLEKRIEGPILLTNLDDALFVLSTVLNTEIIKKDSTIIMRAR